MEIAVRTFYHVPVVGWLTRDAVQGAPDAKYYYLFNILAVFALLVYAIGYPFLIVTLLTATALMLSGLVVLTATDLVDTSLRKRRGHRPARGL